MIRPSENLSVGETLPTGTLKELNLHQIRPSTDNPRHLFDPEPLQSLKDSIRKHGVLVPLTVHQPPASKVYRILDGERRYKCCVLLAEEGFSVKVKANVVDTPDKLSGLLAMFSIHNFREGWELMPTALSLNDVIKELNEENADNKRLKELTGLSEPQIERCRILMQLPERLQILSLDPDPSQRIPSNFWIEADPVVHEAKVRIPIIYDELGGQEGVWDRLVEKYRAKAIKSVIHFRRVMEAFTLPNDSDPDVLEKLARASVRLGEWLNSIPYETRAAFDPLMLVDRRIQQAVEVCANFTRDMSRLKLDYAVDREKLRTALTEVQDYVVTLLEQLKGEDDPDLFSNLNDELED